LSLLKKRRAAFVPDLPGCIATANFKEALKSNILEAFRFHLEGLKAEGLAIPESRSEAEVLSIFI
jgi:predicted RNase H-like HicB family nuclease